jgi:hypothetical protein
VQRAVPNLWGLLVSSPVYVVLIVGIVIAAVRWSRHPRVSLLAISGIATFLFVDAVWLLLAPWLQMMVIRQGTMPARLGFIFGLMNLAASLVRALGWGLVLAALFTGRTNGEVAS